MENLPIPEARIGIDAKDKEAYFRETAGQIKKEVTIPVILVGGLKSFDVIEDVLTKKQARLLGKSASK